jgi:glycosyltransferase involved in cell wall biosynthesis
VHVHGYLPELDSLLSSVRLSIAPLRFGAGIKGKINQSLAAGVPVVATTVAAEGMHLKSEENCLIANAPADFADAVCRLHEDEALWQGLAQAGRDIARKHFSFDAVESRLISSLSSLVDLSAPVPRPLVDQPTVVVP